MSEFKSELLTWEHGTLRVHIYTDQTVDDGLFDIYDLGPIEYINDIPDGGDGSGSVRSIQGTVDVVCKDRMRSLDGTGTPKSGPFGPTFVSLYEQLEAMSSSAFVWFDYTDSAGTDKPFYFSIKQKDVKRNELEGRCKIRMTNVPKDLYTSTSYDTINDVIDAADVDFQDGSSARGFVTGRVFLERVLLEIVDTIPNRPAGVALPGISDIEIDNLRRSKADSDPIILDIDGTEAGLTGEESIFVYDSTVVTAFKCLARLGAQSGAFWGFGFGKVWFQQRLATGSSVILTDDDIVNIESVSVDRAYDNVEIKYDNTFFFPGTAETTVTDSVGEFTDGKTFVYKSGNDAIVRGEVTSGSAGNWTISISKGSSELAGNGFDAYWVAKGHTPSSSYLKTSTASLGKSKMVNMDIIGINQVLPYQAVRITSIDGFNGYYRPSSLKYDFNKNLIEVTRAYRIA